VADVKWEIDVDAKAGKAKEAGSVLERLEKTLLRIDGHTAMLAGHFAEVGERGKGAGEKVHGVFGDILGERIFEKIAEGAKMVVEKLIEIGEEAIKSAAAEERLARVFESYAGSKELGAQNELWTDILSKQTEFNEKQTEGAFLDMKRVGATDQEARLALKAAADIAAVSKNKDEAFGATVEAFARLQRTGVISNRSLAPLGLGVKDFKALDSMKGLSDKAIKKRMEEGKVDQGDLFKLIMSRTHEKAIGEKAANNADLLGTKLSKLTELPERFFKKLADTSAIKTLSTALDGVLAKLDPDSPSGKKISEFLESAFTCAAGLVDKIASGIDGIDFEVVLDGIKGFVEGLKEAFHVVSEIVGKIAEIAGANEFIADVMHKRKQAREIAEGKQAILEGREIPRNETTIKMGLAPRGELVKPGVRAFHGPFHDARTSFNMEDDAAQGQFKMAGDAAGAALGEGMEAGARRKLKLHSPSVVFEDIGAMTAAGLSRGLDRGSEGVDSSMARTFDFGRNASPVGGRRGDINITLATTISLAHGDGTEQGQRAADAFNMKVQAQMISALEQAAIEAGLL